MRIAQIKGSYLGYSFLEIWAFCILYSRNAGHGLNFGSGIGESDPLLWNFSSATVVVATLVILLCFRKIDRMALHRHFTVGATILNVGGTIMILGGVPEVQLCGISLACLGNAWLWVSWGDVFSALDTESVEFVAIGSVALQVIASLAILISPAIVGEIAALLAAPVACLMYLSTTKKLTGNAVSATDEACLTPTHFSKMSLARFAIGLGVPIAVTYYLWGEVLAFDSYAGSIEFSIIVGLLVFVVVFLAFICFSPSISISFICRVELILLIVACLLASCGLSDSLCVSLVFSAMLVSQYLILLYCARLCRQGFGGTVVVFGLGQLINHGFGWLGSSVASVAFLFSDQTNSLPPLVWCILCAIAFFVTVFIQGDDRIKGSVKGFDSQLETLSGRKQLEDIATEYCLSARETEIFLLLAKGRSAPYIRDELVISLNTVSSHVKHIYSKMGLHSRQELFDLVNEGQSESDPCD